MIRALALLLIFPALVAAEPLKIPTTVFAAVNVADIAITSHALSSGRGVEANPLLQGSDAKRIAIKSVTTAGVLVLAHRLDKSAHPKAARIFLYSASAVVGVVAIQNARVR